MNVKTAEKALREIAKREGVSVAEVRREIETTIAIARKNPDPRIRAVWDSIPCKGEFPTPEEVIVYIAGALRR